MYKKLLLLIPVLLLLTLPLAYAVTAQDLLDYTIQLVNFDTNITLDGSVYNNLGSITGTPVHETSIYKLGTGSAKFTGDGHIEFPYIDAYQNGGENFTVSFWVKFDGTTQSQFWDRAVDVVSDGDITIQGDADDKTQFTIFVDGDVQKYIQCTSSTVTSNTWMLLTFTMEIIGCSANKTMYINKTQCNSHNHTSTIADTTEPVWLGERGDGGGDANLVYMDGYVYSNKSWTPDEVEFYWNNGDGIILDTDTTPPNLLNNDAWCTSCDPVQKIDNQPWETDDTTPTINATMNQGATCAIVANLTNVGNYNYSDIINNYGGVECSTTGGADQICTVQSSNALTVGTRYICVGCKGNGDDELRNATFCVEMNITPATVILSLDGLNESRKYEYGSLVNVSANCTSGSGGTCWVELDLYADGYGFNFSSGNNWTSFIFNTTPLRIRNWTHGARKDTRIGSGTFNITSDNKTSIELVSFNISSSGTTTNLNISYYGQKLSYRGDLKTVYLTDNEFLHSGVHKDAVNLTHLSAGSSFIYVDLTDISSTNNLTFELSGFDLDANNEFSYTEHFNGTNGAKEFNETLTYQADAPLGIFDDFRVNVSGRWSATGTYGCPTLTYGTDYLSMSASKGTDATCTYTTEYSDLIADMDGTSKIEIIFYYSVSANQPVNSDCTPDTTSATIRATDGLSTVNLLDLWVSQSGAGSSSCSGVVNLTLERISEDYKSWSITENASCSKNSNGNLGGLNFDNQIMIQFYGNAGGGTCSPQPNCWCSSSSTIKIYQIKWGGAWLNRSTNNGTYKPIGNITQCLVETTDNIKKVSLNAIEYKPAGTAISYYVSNEGGASPTFESIIPDVTHTFSTTGKDLCWRATLNSSINITSPIVRKVEIDITPTSVKNITVDLGDDETDEFTYTGTLNSTNSPTFVNLSPNPNQLNTIKISSATAGLIQVDNFKINSSVNPVSLNVTKFEDCSNCVVNFTFSGSNLEVSDLKFDFLGSWNFTAIARYGSLVINKTIQVIYSNFNVSIPSGYDWYDMFPSSKDSKNVTPYSQTSLTPIWNLSNLAYDEPIDIYVKTNKKIDSCMNITFMNSSNQSNYATDTRFKLNASYQKILSNISVNLTNYPNKGIWCWEDYSNCTSRYLMYPFYFASVCSGCVFDESQLDYYNIIET